MIDIVVRIIMKILAIILIVCGGNPSISGNDPISGNEQCMLHRFKESIKFCTNNKRMMCPVVVDMCPNSNPDSKHIESQLPVVFQ